jgi:hypothetical protein
VTVALVTVALLLCFPPSSFAGADHRAAISRSTQGESSETALRSAGLLARGSGYDNQAGSKAVRELQLRLRRLGHRPGPIDGLFGPLTEASVERFQRARGLQVDGVVGPRTLARLLALPAGRPAAPHGSRTPKPAPDQPAPDRPAPTNVAPPVHPAPDATPAEPAARTPESSDGLEPWLAALMGALATGVLFAGLSMLARRRHGEPAAERRGTAPRSPRSRLNLGMAFAVLLAVFAMGAAIGALFATHAAPGDRDGTEVASSALVSPPGASPVRGARPAEPPPRSRPAAVARRHPPRPPRHVGTAPTPTPRPATGKLPEPGGVPGNSSAETGSAPSATAPPRPVTPVEKPGGTYTVRPGDSLWPIARTQLEAGSSDAAVARRVKRLVDLNVEDRIASGDPDLLTAGEQLRLP